MAKYRCERCGAELPNFENNASFYNFKAKVYLKNSYGTYWQYLLCQDCTDKLMNWIMAVTDINGNNRQTNNEIKNNGI